MLFFSSRTTQEELAKRLDEAFDITFGNDHGGLSFWLADPKPNVRERFGLNKEVLVLYCPHATVDARCLTAIENISRNPDFRHRIDKALFLLVHHADVTQPLALIQSDPDKVIVPFSASELTNPSRGSLFIRTRIAERFGEIDLFGMSSPITSDLYFFGREALVQELVIRTTTKRQNTDLFGLRKTGKTSVLRAVERRFGLPALNFHNYVSYASGYSRCICQFLCNLQKWSASSRNPIIKLVATVAG